MRATLSPKSNIFPADALETHTPTQSEPTSVTSMRKNRLKKMIDPLAVFIGILYGGTVSAFIFWHLGKDSISEEKVTIALALAERDGRKSPR
jgi:hypothetical protein